MNGHPLDSAFNISSHDAFDLDREYGMTEVPKETAIDAQPSPDIKDEDDILIERRIDEVYDAAMEAFAKQSEYTEIIEPRYAARNAEVAANYLNIALQAANSRSRVKTDRKRANQAFVPYPNGSSKTTNNILVASREEILKMITIDGESKEV